MNDGVKDKRYKWDNFNQNTEQTFLNFESYLLINGYLKSLKKEDYFKFLEDVVVHPEKYENIYNHLFNHDQYLDSNIIFNPDYILLYCPSNVLGKLKNDVVYNQMEVMQNVLEISYGDKESVVELLENTPENYFQDIIFRIPVMYMAILKVTQVHTPHSR